MLINVSELSSDDLTDILDIEPTKQFDQSVYIAQIAKLLEQLNSDNRKAVASCDFE